MMLKRHSKHATVFVGVCAVIGLTATIVPAQNRAVAIAPPPPPLSQIVAPDINKLGLLDCTGPGLTTTCSQYLGFPITKSGGSLPTTDPAHPRNKLVALGKALFWDMQVGSDGIQACASCHFHAGADNRYQSQIAPALNRVQGTQLQIKTARHPDQLTPNADSDMLPNIANSTLAGGDFPVGVNTAANAAPDFGNNDIRSSQGVHGGSFTSLSGKRVETGVADTASTVFDAAGVRRVPPRNTPSAHSAIFNLRQFWDGRANLFFNGVNPFGMLDTGATVRVAAQDGSYTQTAQQLMIPFSSLASQAVGPPGSDFEMSLAGRPFQKIGEKLLASTPLARQQVSPRDSVLGPYAVASTPYGLNVTYVSLIKEVFQEKFWKVEATGSDLSLMQANFALFFGLAVQAYEATLIPDQTPLDTLLVQLNQVTLPNPTSGNQLERGLAVFLGQGKCVVCHVGGETTGASVGLLTGFGRPAAPAGAAPEVLALSERMVMGDGNLALYDTGFYNVGIRPTGDDLSIFGRVNNVPFSFGMLAQEILAGYLPVNPVNQLLLSGKLLLPTSPTNLAPRFFGITVGCAPNPKSNGTALGIINGNKCKVISATEPNAIRGAFKAPQLRNSVFTGPYFHSGGMKNLNEVLTFYNTGGRFNMAFNPQQCAKTSSTCLIGQVDFDPAILPLGLTNQQMDDLQYLVEVGMVDSRVAQETAPFDHPQLCVPHGMSDPEVLVDIPAIGAEGHAQPLLTFEQTMTNGANVTGKHDHNLASACGMSPLPNVP